MILQIISTIIIAILCGVLGRMGGSDKYSTLWRDIGVSLLTTVLVGIWGGWHWTLIFCFGIMWGTLTTYFKKKGEPVRWYNWIFCGIAYCLAFLPYIIAEGLWLGFGIRILILPVAVMGWCVLIGNAVIEEFGRYFLVALSVPLMFIGRKKK